MALSVPTYSAKDIEGNNDLEVGDEEGEETGERDDADALQHAFPGGDHGLLLG